MFIGGSERCAGALQNDPAHKYLTCVCVNECDDSVERLQSFGTDVLVRDEKSRSSAGPNLCCVRFVNKR